MKFWNPFARVELAPVIPAADEDVTPAIGSETTDDQYRNELEGVQLRSLLARTQITMIHESLAVRSLNQLRGGT